MSNTSEDEELEFKMWSDFIASVLLKEPIWSPLLYAVIMGIIFVVGIVGNLLTCIVIYSDRTMHTATNFYLFNLAVSDLLVTLAILLEIYEAFFAEEQRVFSYMFGELTCKIHFFLVVTLWNNGILIMTALAVERYLAICYPLMLQSASVLRRVMKVILLIWIIAIVETLPEIWTVNLSKTKGASICFTSPTRFSKYLNGVLAVITFVIPLGIMVFVYSMIAFQVNVVQKNNGRDKIFNHRDNRSKVNKLIIALTLSFMVCWLPFFVVRVLVFSLDIKQLISLNTWWIVMYKVSAVNSWFSAVLNPLLFSLMSTKFRKSLKALWDYRVKGKRPDSYGTTVIPV